MILFLVKLFAFTFPWIFVQSADKSIFLQKLGEDNEALLRVTWTENDNEIFASCEFFSDKDQIKKVLQSSNNADIQIVSKNEMQGLLGECTERVYSDGARESEHRVVRRATTTPFSDTTTAGYDGIPVIFPGTKWCGAGDRAKHYDDLGLHQDTDRCCRAHDLCNDTLAPGETRNKLTNKSPFTKLSCQCDNDFYDCLDRINSVTSNTIGNMYFNILKRECYQEDYPSTKKCKKYRTFLKIKCLEYHKDKKAGKVYQWVPARKYKKIPFPGPLTITLPF